jgi:hypothetical protein
MRRAREKMAGTLRFARPALIASGKTKRAAADGHRPLSRTPLLT